MAALTSSPIAGACGDRMTQPPPYSVAHDSSPSSSVYSLPEYSAATTLAASASASASASFTHTLSYQIESKGSVWLSLPTSPKPDPIPVYAVGPASEKTEKVYESIRPERKSGSCTLYAAGSNLPVSSTTYRFGPGKPPVIRLHRQDHVSSAAAELKDEGFEVASRGATTRSVLMRTPLGTYQWRYGRRDERKACNADSLLILEKVTTIALAGGKTKEVYTRVAQFVRNDEFRTQGTSKHDAGNGGRLMMDLSGSEEKKSNELEVFIVTGAICMLKREIDRRRTHKMIIMGAGAGC